MFFLFVLYNKTDASSQIYVFFVSGFVATNNEIVQVVPLV